MTGMNLKFLRNLLIIIAFIQTILWIAGVILANIFLILPAIIITIAILPVVYLHRDEVGEMFRGDSSEVVEDERTQLINEKSSTMTLGIFVGAIIYLGLFMLALRSVYPQLLLAGCTLLLTAVLCFIIYFLTRAYYNRKY